MKILLLITLVVVSARAAEIPIVFENRPEFGVPIEAQRQEHSVPAEAQLHDQSDHGSHGPLSKALGDSLESVTVRYFNKAWTDQKQVTSYLTGLLADPKTEMYAFQIWQQSVGEPEIECILNFKQGSQGRLLLWGTAACYRDQSGKWWFLSVFDYYHRQHPQGTRSSATKPTKKEN